jgi:hypothetical protein
MRYVFLLVCTICGYTFTPTADETARDLIYCQALTAKYRTYIDSLGGHHPSPSPEAELAMDECHLGDTRGVHTLEHELRRNGIDLPPRN